MIKFDVKEYRRRYYRKHEETIKKRVREYCQLHKKERGESHQVYYEEYKEKIKKAIKRILQEMVSNTKE